MQKDKRDTEPEIKQFRCCRAYIHMQHTEKRKDMKPSDYILAVAPSSTRA